MNYTPITHPHVWTLALVGPRQPSGVGVRLCERHASGAQTHLATRGAVRLRRVGGREGFSSPARHTHKGKGRGTPSRWQTRCYGTRGKACLPLTCERVGGNRPVRGGAGLPTHLSGA
eukprot:scaffold33_cov122-Isochrysis_galbana.AAC.2